MTLVFGALAPERIAMQRAGRWTLRAARPLATIARLARPAIWLSGASTDVVVRVAGGDPTNVARAAVALPESIGVIDALRAMQTQRQQLAVAVNEYGGTEGIVTVEDLLEEIVPVHEVIDFGVEVPEV